MKYRLAHEIDNYPEPEDVGTTRVTARIFGQDDNSTFTTLLLAKDFILGENDEFKITLDLVSFLMEAGINAYDIMDAMLKLIVYVNGVTFPASIEYSPERALNFRLDLVPDYLDDDDDDSPVQEAVQASFDDTSNIRFRPASKLVVKSLTRRIYNKKIKKEKSKKKKKMMISLEECSICLQEFSKGGKVVTLSCGHEFDDECIVKWFETSHVCPLCRLELPCQDEL